MAGYADNGIIAQPGSGLRQSGVTLPQVDAVRCCMQAQIDVIVDEQASVVPVTQSAQLTALLALLPCITFFITVLQDGDADLQSRLYAIKENIGRQQDFICNGIDALRQRHRHDSVGPVASVWK